MPPLRFANPGGPDTVPYLLESTSSAANSSKRTELLLCAWQQRKDFFLELPQYRQKEEKTVPRATFLKAGEKICVLESETEGDREMPALASQLLMLSSVVCGDSTGPGVSSGAKPLRWSPAGSREAPARRLQAPSPAPPPWSESYNLQPETPGREVRGGMDLPGVGGHTAGAGDAIGEGQG